MMDGAARFLGVDGGGTKTRFVLIDGDGRILAEAQRGTTYHPQVGLDGVQAVLAEGVAEVLDASATTREQIDHAFFGIPAFGEDSRVMPRLQAIPGEVLGHARYVVDNDMVCGWAGSLDCADGINIIAGTGSMGYGRCGANAARAGGWGELFSDEGSAYWIAVQGLNAYSRMSDGRLPKGPLYAQVNRRMRLERDLDLCARLYGEDACSRGEIAQLSLLVTEAAQEGDVAARAIFERAAQELALIADSLRKSLGFAPGADVPLSYSGGAFSAGELLLRPFEAALQTACADFRLRAPIHAPHYGAARYAARLAAQG